MIEIKFKYNNETNLLVIAPIDKEYNSISMISNWGWTSERVIEDIENVEKCKIGEYRNEHGEDNIAYNIGIENSLGLIYVANWGPAWVCDYWDSSKEPYLEISLVELKDFLEQMRDFLISVGK